MNEFITLSIQLHIVCVVLLVGIILMNVYWLRQKRTFFTLSKRLELLAPQYFIVLSAIFFTGIIVMAVGQFSFSWAVLEMIVVWIMLVAIGMKGHKLYKRLDKKNEQAQELYKQFAMNKELFALVLIAFLLVLIYGVH